MKILKVLIACEESQTVCKAFRELGHEAYSNDLQDCSGGHPEWHLKMDVFEAIKLKEWDLIISFQPCTDLTCSGARWFVKKRLSGEQKKSIIFFFKLWRKSNCSENPIGIMNGGKYIKKWYPDLYEEMLYYGFPFEPDQIIQPYQFGHPETKATCLWLKNLPKLKPANIVEPDYMRKPNGEYYKDKKGKRYSRIHFMSRNNPDRAKERSKTFPGIAKAMAEQWSKYILEKETDKI